MRNPVFLDSESGFNWTVNPEVTGQHFLCSLPIVGVMVKCPVHLFFDISFLIESAFMLMVIMCALCTSRSSTASANPLAQDQAAEGTKDILFR